MTTKLTKTTTTATTRDFTAGILKTGSLAERLAARATARKTVILCDTSGSMGTLDVQVGRETRSRIEQLVTVLAGFEGHEVRQFNTYVSNEPITTHSASGGTDMANAFIKMKAEGFEHIVLLTDGVPDDATAALWAAIDLKIDALYIGPGEPPDFLRQLTAQTNGTFGSADLAQPAAIASAIKGLLA